MKQLYKNIRQFREELGLSQQELAEKVGYKSRTSIAKIEAGKVDLSNSKIEDFAKVFGISSTDLTYLDSSTGGLQDIIRFTKKVDGQDGLIAILNDIYGDAKMREAYTPNGSCLYVSLDNEFAISDENFENLYGSVKSVVKQLTDLVKEDREKLHQNCLDSLCNDSLLNAAHERTDIEVTDEMRQHDDDIMDDENF